ncbi:MAG: hypothetical protein EHM49_03330 [Deltaproteobacteria bacterium]|nr:MAG: hypothetical protein EHM49_03330 [Deltaproteobacteria bacterium]
MSILKCYLAAEKEKDGKPFTVCDVGTWFYLEIGMLESTAPEDIPINAKLLYDSFGSGKDKTERGVTFHGLKRMKSNGGIRIIPKTKDRFVKMADWVK